MDHLLLKPDEAAALLAVSRSKFYSLLASGVIPNVRLWHSIRIPAEALRRWVEEQCSGGAEAEVANADVGLPGVQGDQITVQDQEAP